MIYRQFAERFGWPPSLVNQLTWYQIAMYSCEMEDLGGIQRVSSEQAVSVREAKQIEQGLFS